MPYERELLGDSPSALPNQQQTQFKEERVIDPYRFRRGVESKTQAAETSKVGQPATSTGSEAPPSPTVETVTLSPAAAALARKEQMARKRELEFKEEKDRLEKDKAEVLELKALREKLAKKDFSGIENLVPYDEFTNYLIEKGQSEDPIAKEIKKLDAKIEDLSKAQKSDVDKRFEAAVQERRKMVTDLVSKDPKFSAIKKLKAEEHVVQHILDTWEHDSVDLTPEQAALEVQEVLKEKAKVWAGALEEEKAPETTPESKNLPPLKPQLKTITNNLTAAGETNRPKRSFQGMSDTERWAEARRRAEEKLKGQG
jgi:hypothetical protein